MSGIGAVALLAATAPAGAAGPRIAPSSNLVVGAGTYPAVVSAPRNALPPVPNPSGGITGAGISATTGSTRVTGAPGTFTTAMIGSFLDDGTGALVADGEAALPLNESFPVYPRQGIPRIRTVATDGSSATMSQPAIGSGSGSTYVVAPVAAQVVIIQGLGGLPYIVDVYTPVTNGLCLTPLWPDAECGYDAGNLQWQTGVAIATAGLDGSLAPTAFTIREGAPDGNLGVRTTGSVWAKYFDPDADGPAPVAPWAVPAGTPGAIERTCRPDELDRRIPNPWAGGVDYCVVNVIGINAGRSVDAPGKPFSYYAVPITWAASISAQVVGSDLVITGTEFANDDVILRLLIRNAKAKVTGTTTACPALNRIVTAAEIGPADGVGTFTFTIPDYATGCTVPTGSMLKVVALGSRDIQKSQIPGDPDLGMNRPKKATGILLMP
ncbi:MAG: hypothetical protein RL531_559 [Actinomycetota bacterium]